MLSYRNTPGTDRIGRPARFRNIGQGYAHGKKCFLWAIPLLSESAADETKSSADSERRSYALERGEWEAMHAYCLYCERQRCGRIAQLLELQPGIQCISPVIIQRKWIGKTYVEEKHDWLPNYLFLYSDEPIQERNHIPGIIRWLGNGELTGSDLAFAQMLYAKNGVLGTVRLAEEGDRCIINDPLWKDTEGHILKIDRGRKRCCVEVFFDELPRKIWLGYDLVQRKD